MERVEKDWQWSLFDPKKVPDLTDKFGEDFETRLHRCRRGRPLRETGLGPTRCTRSMMRTLAQTGNGWMTFKDASNEKCNQTGALNEDGTPRVVHLSNLCTEILEVTDQAQHCGLQPRVAQPWQLRLLPTATEFDFDRLGRVVRQVVPFLDRVIDINYYPTPEAKYLEQQVASRRPRHDGSAGCLL